MKGRVVWLFAFDVANEIKTGSIREVLSETTFAFEVKVSSTIPKEVEFSRPLTIAPKPVTFATPGGPVTLELSVLVFDVGVLSLAYSMPIDATRLEELVILHRTRFGEVELEQAALQVARRIAEDLSPFLVSPSFKHTTVEAYTVFCLRDVGANGDVPTWAAANRRSIAALLCEEKDAARLAPMQVDETMRLTVSYSVADLAVVDWDAALLVNEHGYFDDVLHVIELANLQLEEFRLLDERLDGFTNRAHRDLENYYRKPLRGVFPESILRKLRAIRLDMTRMSEEVGNITKFVGDWHLARLYLHCRDRFHLSFWQSGLERKLDDLDDLYSIVKSDIFDRRMLVLEVIIVALFLLDVIVLIAGKLG